MLGFSYSHGLCIKARCCKIRKLGIVTVSVVHYSKCNARIRVLIFTGSLCLSLLFQDQKAADGHSECGESSVTVIHYRIV